MSRELSSWKEIAAYLGVSVRAAQMWEAQRSLPVRRLAGPRARVLAYAHELDEWKNSNAILKVQSTPSTHVRETFIGRKALIPSLVLFSATLAAIIIARQPFAVSPPELIEVKPLSAARSREMNPALSPDASLVAYLCSQEKDGLFELRIRPREVDQARTILRGLSLEDRFAWSPKSESLAIARLTEGGPVIQVLAAADGTTRRTIPMSTSIALRQVTMEARSVAWMPEGERLCFSHSESDEGSSLYLVELKSGLLKRLSLPPGGVAGDFQCTPSPDGSKVAFVRQQTVSEGDLFVLDMSSGQLRRLTHLRAHFAGLSWHPRKNALVFGSRLGSAMSGLWQLALDGSAPQRLTGNEVHASYPSLGISADAVHLIYQTNHKDLNIYRIAEGSEPKQLTDSALTDHYPAVGPNGELAWISHRSGYPQLWFQARVSEAPSQITDFPKGYLDFPKWSNDGRWIAFSAPITGGRGIMLLDVAKRESRPLFPNPVDEGRASFSGDGKHMYFRSSRSGTPNIWKIAYQEPNASPIQVTDGGAFEAQEDSIGGFLYFVKSRSQAGLYRQALHGGEAQLVESDIQEGRWGIANGEVFRMSGLKDGSIIIEKALLREAPLRFRRIFRSEIKAEAGMSISPDGRNIYLSLLDRHDTDIYSAKLH